MRDVRQPPSAKSLVLIETRPLLRETFARSLREATDFSVEAVQQLENLSERAAQPSVIVLSLPDGLEREDIERVFGRVKACGYGSVPIIVLSGAEDLGFVMHALECGAKGYITTSMALDVAVAVIRLVAAGGTFAPAGTLMDAARVRGERPQDIKQKPQGSLFTERQTAVIEALRKGMGNKMIASALNLRESTVKVHVRKIMRKLNATNRTQAAFLASQLRGE